MNNKRKITYIGLLMLITVFLLITGKSWAFFTSTDEYHSKVNIVAGTLDYKIESSELDSNNSISLQPNESKIFDIKVTSLNTIDSKYELYINNIDGITGGYLNDTNYDGVSGTIPSNSSKKVKMALSNPTNTIKTIVFGIQGGFTHNNLVVDGVRHINQTYQRTITLDEQNPTTSGTTSIYEVYDIGYYLDSSRTTKMTTKTNPITIPKKTGYKFVGYYTEPNGGGTRYINQYGKLTNDALTTNFSADGTLYAYWVDGTTITITANGSGNIQFLNDKYLLGSPYSDYGQVSQPMPDYVFVDGISITPATSYNFATGGDHTIVLKWNDPTRITQMYSMFRDCSSLTSVDFSNFDTSNVNDFDMLFGNCSSLTSVDFSNVNTSNVEVMEGVFASCSGLTSVDLSDFDTSSVKWINHMFYGCSSLTNLDLSSFDISNEEAMHNMFNGCSSLTNLDLSNFDFSSAQNYNDMFTNVPNNIAIKSSSTACSWIATNSGITASNYTCTQP